MFNLIAEISVEELALHLADHDDNLQLIDVRERGEVEIAYIQGFSVLPLSEYQQWEKKIKTQFDPDQETLVICHHGIRSAQMCQWLRSQGFSNVKNIVGGIDAYSILVDSSIPRY
jgi:rhodanese-related sulfurtransferase